MKKHTKPTNKNQKPLWGGPTTDGITFSLLNRFIECRERFRLRVVEGLADDEGFQRSMEYGSMWHAAEEGLASQSPSRYGSMTSGPNLGNAPQWLKNAQSYRNKLLEQYPDDHDEINHWYSVLKAQFPVYIKQWRARQRNVKYVLQETTFRVPYVLKDPTTSTVRTVILRGKWDAVLLRGKSIFLQENKTKGEIDEEGIMATVDQNLQVMFYLIALKAAKDSQVMYLPEYSHPYNIAGVLYNVVRRPLADRYAIRQKKSETKKEFYQRLQGVIAEDPDHYFKRWEANITPKDIKAFQRECFDPLLRNLCDWWDSIKDDPFNPWETLHFPTERDYYDWKDHGKRNHVVPNRHHWRTPFGIHNSLAGGFRGSYFKYLTKHSMSDLKRISTLYPELEE